MEPFSSLPFLVRKMLTFEHNAVFSLRIVSQGNAARRIHIRGITKEGPFVFAHTTDAGGFFATEDFRIPDVPIMVSVVDQSTAFKQGECYVTLSLMVNGNVLYDLCSGLVYNNKGVSYPASNNPDQRK